MTSRLHDYRPMLIIALAAALIVNGAVIGWVFWLAERRPNVELSQPTVASPVNLCPGERLNYFFMLSVDKKAAVDLYTTVERRTEGDRISYTHLQHFDFDDAIEVTIRRNWILPAAVTDPISGTDVAWQPGAYVQRSLAGVVGSTKLSTIEVPFSVRQGCIGGH